MLPTLPAINTLQQQLLQTPTSARITPCCEALLPPQPCPHNCAAWLPVVAASAIAQACRHNCFCYRHLQLLPSVAPAFTLFPLPPPPPAGAAASHLLPYSHLPHVEDDPGLRSKPLPPEPRDAPLPAGDPACMAHEPFAVHAATPSSGMDAGPGALEDPVPHHLLHMLSPGARLPKSL